MAKPERRNFQIGKIAENHNISLKRESHVNNVNRLFVNDLGSTWAYTVASLPSPNGKL